MLQVYFKTSVKKYRNKVQIVKKYVITNE